MILKNKSMINLINRSVAILRGRNSFFNLSSSVIIIAVFAVAVVGVLGFGGSVSAVEEDLDEMMLRKDRHSTASWGPEWLEDSSNNYMWNSESFMYHDKTYGTEVWKLTGTNDVIQFWSNTVDQQVWSADGKRAAFMSKRMTHAYDKTVPTGPIWFIVDTDGGHLRAGNNIASREVWDNVSTSYSWSPIELDVSYDCGSDKYGADRNRTTLYRVTVSDSGDDAEEWLTYPESCAVVKSMSPRGEGALVFKQYREVVYPSTIYPPESKQNHFANGITTNRPHGSWGATPDTILIKGLNPMGSIQWMQVMPSGSSVYWKFKTFGSNPDGGSNYTHDTTWPYDWGGEAEPINTVGGGDSDPWCDAPVEAGYDCMDNASHTVLDFWGRYAFFGRNEHGEMARVFDINSHTMFIEQFPNIIFQHGSAKTWSDDWVTAGNPDAYNSSTEDKIYRVKYNDSYDTEPILYTHACYNSPNNKCYGTAYWSTARPVLSPDGTKTAFQGTMFNNDLSGGNEEQGEVMWGTMYYPHPPEITQVTSSSGSVSIRFDWGLDRTTRGYTARGWPDEDTDNPPAPRETKLFRLWRSSDGATWEPQGTVNANPFTKFDFMDGGLKNGQVAYWEITDIPGEGTWYYGVTSLEHSGLESHTLSNIYQIAVSGGNGTGSQSVSYPADPKADTDIITLYNSDLIRYYNIYALDGSTPAITQDRRMASVSLSSGTSFIDVFGKPDGTTQYVVTAVDTQGNESTALDTTYAHKKSPAIADGQYTIEWSGASSPDTTPPSCSNPQPTGELVSGTTQTPISLTTNETATCKYSTNPNTAYASMANTFSTTGSTTHS